MFVRYCQLPSRISGKHLPLKAKRPKMAFVSWLVWRMHTIHISNTEDIPDTFNYSGAPGSKRNAISLTWQWKIIRNAQVFYSMVFDNKSMNFASPAVSITIECWIYWTIDYSILSWITIQKEQSLVKEVLK